MRKLKSKPKPEIVNFRVKWSKVWDLCAIVGMALFMLWMMWAATVAILTR